MRWIATALLVISLIACKDEIYQSTSQTVSLGVVPYSLNPPTPSKEELDVVSFINYDNLKVVDPTLNGFTKHLYFLESNPFSGWAKKEFEDTHHKYRYTRYIKGQAIWQIGYFENGAIDHDFHMENGLYHGSQRMWNSDGSPYIDTYFLKGGVQHGSQKRWHTNGQVAMEAYYNNGIMLSENLFDRNGNPLD